VSIARNQKVPKVEDLQQPKAFVGDGVNAFSQDEIRVRAYQIYESRSRNGNHPEDDWSQAETELAELLHAK